MNDMTEEEDEFMRDLWFEQLQDRLDDQRSMEVEDIYE